VRKLLAIDSVRSTFVSTVAHDVRMPMSVIANTADVLLADWHALGDDERNRYLTSLSHRVRKLSRFVEDMLDIARVETGDLTASMAAIDLVQTARGVVADLQAAYPDHDIELVTSHEKAMAWADERFQWQMLENLVGNACKFSTPDQPVWVHVEVAESEILVKVVDHGQGIPEEHLERIFDRFHRAVPQGIPGSGLGLYIVSQLAAAQGCRVSVVSELHRGSVFTYSLERDAVQFVVGPKTSGG
jgi:signal transduction histidine kinase